MRTCPDHPYEDINRCPQCRTQRGRPKPPNFEDIKNHARQQARAEREQARKEATQ